MTGIEAGLSIQLGQVADQVEQVSLFQRQQADNSRFIPRKLVQAEPVVAGPMNTVMWVVIPVTPVDGKIWNIVAAGVTSNDTANGTWQEPQGAPTMENYYSICVGNPNHPSATVQPFAAVAAEASALQDSIGGASDEPRITSQTFSRYAYWVWPGDRIYALYSGFTKSLSAGTQLIMTAKVNEYEIGQIVPNRTGGHGQHRTHQTHVLPEA